MKSIFFLFCLLLSAGKASCQTKDTFEVYFAFNSPKISKESEDRIDQLIFKDTLIHGDKLIILGYADYVGGNSHNDTLSRQRAGRVRDYLVNMGFDKKDITLCIGKGKIKRSDVKGREGYAPDRKVQIIIDRTPAPVAAARPVPTKDIAEVKVNETYTMRNMSFEPGLPIMLPQSYPDLKRLLTYLLDYPRVTIRIEGHVCCLGPDEGLDGLYNGRNLSECRAETIYKYLAGKGIAKDRMSYVGLGNRNPVVKHEVIEEDRIKNRRVEIRILSK